MSRFYHLAQVNVGRTIAPLDSPLMAEFVRQLPGVNALAEASPGFVWRLTDATGVQAFEDPHTLINMSVWETAEALKNYTYSGDHLAAVRDRLKWFERPAQPHLALWWVPAGHIPTVAEAIERLEFRRAHGDSNFAFSISSPYPAPDESAPAPSAAEIPSGDRQQRATAKYAGGLCDW